MAQFRNQGRPKAKGIARRGVNRSTRKARQKLGKLSVQKRIKKKLVSRARPRVTSTLSRPSHLSDAALEFLDAAEDILAIYKARSTAPVTDSPYDQPIKKFKRLAYELIRSAISSPGKHNTIKNIHRELGIEHRGPSFDENPFYWGLVAFDENRETLTPHTIGLFSRQMFYAHKHNVPPCLLIGFLHQIGDRAKMSLADMRSTWEDWKGAQMTVAYEIPKAPLDKSPA